MRTGLAAASMLVLVVALAACGGGHPGLAEARRACDGFGTTTPASTSAPMSADEADTEAAHWADVLNGQADEAAKAATENDEYDVLAHALSKLADDFARLPGQRNAPASDIAADVADQSDVNAECRKVLATS